MKQVMRHNFHDLKLRHMSSVFESRRVGGTEVSPRSLHSYGGRWSTVQYVRYLSMRENTSARMTLTTAAKAQRMPQKIKKSISAYVHGVANTSGHGLDVQVSNQA
jgi:hypothetical protein